MLYLSPNSSEIYTVLQLTSPGRREKREVSLCVLLITVAHCKREVWWGVYVTWIGREGSGCKGVRGIGEVANQIGASCRGDREAKGCGTKW